MTSFVPTTYYFLIKKTAGEAHRICIDVHDEHCASDMTCTRFQNREFVVGDKENRKPSNRCIKGGN